MRETMATKDITDLQVCTAVHQRMSIRDTTNIKTNLDVLQELTGQPYKVCWRALERACKRGYLDYGVSLRFAWLDEAGKTLLKVGAQ
jgi:hypothetical protein